MKGSAERACELMKILSHPDRLMILCQLKEGEKSVGELAELVGIAQSPLSQHLARMRHQGVVTTRREAQTIFYSISGDEAEEVIALLYRLYCHSDQNAA
ncbi:MAG: metalloregulator ArsR/SmtB family transcription factor [Xanthomonadales bacterium]|nr:metalloregulator ArsR/SmtB family transcription factor [Xanthomonadales bacterium]